MDPPIPFEVRKKTYVDIYIYIYRNSSQLKESKRKGEKD